MRLLFFFLIMSFYTKQMNAQVLNLLGLTYPIWSVELEERAKTNPAAMNILGYYYLIGNGVEKNEKKAVSLFEKSIVKPHEDIGRAYNNLGYCYEHGLGVEADINKAFQYYYNAAINHDSNSYVNLAECYELGKGTEEQLDSALFWYQKAIDRGTRDGIRKAQVRSGYILIQKNDINKAMGFLEQAAKRGSGFALYLIGFIYDNGLGKYEKDATKAVYYYKESVENEEYPYVLTKLADHYYDGSGCEKNIDKAKELYRDAARKGDPDAKKRIKELGL